MNLQKLAVQLLIVLNFVTAIPDANSQQGNLRGPKSSTPKGVEQQRQREAQSDTYGPIVSSDTLWRISQNYRPNSSLSIYQVMQAIFELNPDAFEQQNINLLKDGSILKMPSESSISSVNSKQAQKKSELDSQSLQPNISNQSSQQPKNITTLDQTRELIDQNLVAIDEAQNRQFMAIRKQFAESISSVQNILDENKKLFERLDKVNTDIDEMRSEEQQKSLQMKQMGKSIEELLERSRQDDAEKAAQATEKTSWLDNPIILILLFTLPVLLALSAFAYWMIKRKNAAALKPQEDDADDFSLNFHSSEMDNLSDALSAELSNESGDELDDDNLFGDDVLAEALEEALNDEFDDLGDDDVLKEEFEVGTGVVEQDDLDSLFDEDEHEYENDNVFAETDAEISAQVSLDIANELLAEAQNNDENSGSSDTFFDKDKQQIDVSTGDIESKRDEPLLTPTDSVVNDNEQPDANIDESFNGGAIDEPIKNPLANDSENINEDMLKSIDKEIASQNEELDSVTGSLIDELEQVEQMRSMIPDDDDDDDDDELFVDEELQFDVSKLDNVEEVEEVENLSANGDKHAESEINISKVPTDTSQLIEPIPKALELVESELYESEELIGSESKLDKTEESVGSEPELDESEKPAESELELDETEELAESELELGEAEELVESAPEQVETEEPFESGLELEPEPVEAEKLAESELRLGEAEVLVESDSEQVETEETSESGLELEPAKAEKLAESGLELEPVEAEKLAESELELGEAEELVESDPEQVETEESSESDLELEPVEVEKLAESELELGEAEELAESDPEEVETEELVESDPEQVETEEPSESGLELEPVEAEKLAESELELELELDEAEELVESDPEQVETEELSESGLELEPAEAEKLAESELELDKAEKLAESELELGEAEELVESDPEQVETEEPPESGLELEPVEAEKLAEPELELGEAEELVESDPELDETEELAASESEPEVDDSIGAENWLEAELGEEPELEVPVNSDSILDEDQLEKALEDFEKEELDEVLADLTSNVSTSIGSLDNINSIRDFDDSELDNAFEEDFDEVAFESLQDGRDDLDNLPTLGDWLDEDVDKPDDRPTERTKDREVIDEFEDLSFDEILNSMDFDNEISVTEDDTGFDIATLLNETPQNKDSNSNETDEFLDVESLLNESVNAESDDEIDRVLNLEFPLEPFVAEQDELNMIDVDDGLGAKLDLAHAYIEIGEDEAAKELLDEVLQKGNVEQITEAKMILSKLD
jgi:pilus assembly protein FimV